MISNFALLILIDGAVDLSRSTRIGFFAINGALFGIIDYLVNGLVVSTLVAFFPHDSAASFGWYRFNFCVGFAVEAILATFTSYLWMAALTIVVSVVSMVGLIVLMVAFHGRKVRSASMQKDLVIGEPTQAELSTDLTEPWIERTNEEEESDSALADTENTPAGRV